MFFHGNTWYKIKPATKIEVTPAVCTRELRTKTFNKTIPLGQNKTSPCDALNERILKFPKDWPENFGLLLILRNMLASDISIYKLSITSILPYL